MMNESIEDDDAWDYEFPKSEDAPVQTKTKLRISTDAAKDIPESIDETDVNSGESEETSSLQVKKRKQQFLSMSHSMSTSSLQSPFLAKSSPANPHTTKEDANSIISEDNNKNDSTSHLTTIQNRNLEQSINIANESKADSKKADPKSPYTPGKSSSLKNKLEPSPKIISYRKSKRTTSDGSYPDVSSPKDDFDKRLYMDEFYKDTTHRYAIMRRNIDFHQLFPSLDLTDRFLDDFACALSREILLQGRVYISEHYVCFNSNLLGWVTSVVIPMHDIVKFEKKSTAGIFPNGITIETKDQTYIFASFVSRDSTFEFMKTVWEEETGNKSDDTDEPKDSTPIIESYILSIDGDDYDNDNDNNDSLDEKSDNETIRKTSEIKTKILKFKQESKYKNMGPDVHAPTSAEFEVDPNEIELLNETFSAPLGVVYDILFGSSNTAFHTSRIEANAGSEISEYDIFHPMEDDPTKLERSYTYRKGLGYSIGPKSTKCVVSEVIEHLNFADYIVVLSTTLTPDVPLGNSFSVKTRYVFTWGENNQTNLKLSFFIKWTGRSWIKAVIDKQSQAGQTEAANSLLIALKEEINKSTYYIDGPTLTKETEYVLEEATPKPKSVVSKPTRRVSSTLEVPSIPVNSTSIIVLLGLVVLSLFVFQLKMYKMVLETNQLIQKQLLLNTHLLLEKKSRRSKVEMYPDDFWGIISDKVGKELTNTERLEYLLDQLNLLYIEDKE